MNRKQSENGDYPTRKPNRLKGYDYSRNGAYFITLCTRNKEPIFGRIVGGGVFDAPHTELTEIGECADRRIRDIEKSGYAAVDKFAVMPNHIHMIVFVHNGPSRTPAPTNAMIPHVISTFKRFVHRDVGKTVFQRSYYDHIIRDERDYRKIWEYIDTNPLRWAEDIFYIHDA